MFSFALIADLQYADMDNGTNLSGTRTRYYRNAIKSLRKAIEDWDSMDTDAPDFLMQLGDVMDGWNTGPKG